MTEKQKYTEEEYKQLVEKLKNEIIEDTKKRIICCKICGFEYKTRKQPLIKTEDGYICRGCRGKYKS